MVLWPLISRIAQTQPKTSNSKVCLLQFSSEFEVGTLTLAAHGDHIFCAHVDTDEDKNHSPLLGILTDRISIDGWDKQNSSKFISNLWFRGWSMRLVLPRPWGPQSGSFSGCSSSGSRDAGRISSPVLRLGLGSGTVEVDVQFKFTLKF